MIRPLLAAACATTMLASFPAEAAIVDLNFEFIASDFSSGPAPFDPVAGKFSFSFDNAASFEGTTSGLTVHSFTLPGATYPVNFAYQQATDIVILSTFAASPGCGTSPTDNNFCTFIYNVSTAPEVRFFYYTASLGSTYYAGKIDYGVTTAAVPEPASWAMMIAGFGLVGGALRRRGAVKVGYAG